MLVLTRRLLVIKKRRAHRGADTRYTGGMRHGLLVLATFALLPFIASAQFMGGADQLGQTPFTLTVTPQYPTPYGKATLSFVSSVLDLANATMTVSVAGKKIYQGNVQTTSVSLGKAGVPVKVAVTIASNGVKYTQSATIQPQDVALIAEPVSSAPPLYAGKPETPLEGNVRVVAMANLVTGAGKKLDPASLSYSWTVDDTQIAKASGIGRQALLVAVPLQYRTRTVSVVVMSPDGTLVGSDSLTLSSENPTVRLYEDDPLLGIRFDHALGDTYTIGGSETTLYAAPFSFSTSNGTPSLSWTLNGSPAQTGAMITLRPAGSGQGNASLSLTASSGETSSATADLSLIFGSKSSSNFFGL